MKNNPTIKSNQKTLVGKVVSCAMDKTVVVEVARFIKHPKYGKYLTRHKKYKAHDPNNQGVVGTEVTIRECPPISKDKRFIIVS